MLDDDAVHALPGARRDTPEQLLVAQDDAGLRMGVYIEAAALSQLRRDDPDEALHSGNLRAFALLAEGVSHFLCVSWCAANDRSVSPLELELQAEIDKFVCAALLLRAQTGSDQCAPLIRVLFDHIRFDPALDASERDRYRTANGDARRYCQFLAGYLVARRFHELRRELRRFYRLSRNDKVGRIGEVAQRTHG